MVAVAHRARLQRGDVRAATGLGDGERGDLLARDDRSDEAVDLGGAPEADDGWQRDAVAAETHDRSDGLAGEHELLARDEHVRDVAAAASAIRGVADAEQPGAREVTVERAGKLLGLVPGVGVRGDLLLGELARLRSQRGVLVRLEQVGLHAPT